jgi:hypothetical protein
MPAKAKSKPRGKIIKVPAVPAKAYNPERPASGLLRSHVEELEKAAGAVRGRPAKKAMTEGEAARYIRQLTRQLHHDVLVADGPALSFAPRSVAQKPRPGAASRKRAVSSKAPRHTSRSRRR